MLHQTHAALYVHLVWSTWERQPWLQGAMGRQVYRLIGARCQELHIQIIALGGIEDHVHLLVSLPTTLSVAQVAKQIKGASSHFVNGQLASSPTQFFKWQAGYGAVTVSPSGLREVAHYITHQREHHAAGSLIDGWEPRADAPGESAE